MLNNNNVGKEILEAYGWKKIGSNNKYMVSYTKENMRLNHYFTTGTVTIQNGALCSTYRDVFSDAQMELIISD